MTTRLTFVGNPPYPARRNDWERLAGAAQGLLDQRDARYPALVEAGKLDAREAERGLRIMRAIVAQWRAVVDGHDLPAIGDYGVALGAEWPEMTAELARAADRAAQLAARNPGDAALGEQAELTKALAWHQQPTMPGAGFPHIWIAHDYTQWERRLARAVEGQAA